MKYWNKPYNTAWKIPDTKFCSLVIIILLWVGNAAAQNAAFTTPDIELMKGKWSGSLTYLDYKSGKPYTMPAEVEVSYIPDSKALIFYNSYPDEPKANGRDTLLLTNDGKKINNEEVRNRIIRPAGIIQIITEYNGEDGNDHKPALIRHTYIMGKHIFSIKKEVKFNGQDEWILRNIYSYTKE